MRRDGSRISSLVTIRLYLRELSAVYPKYTGTHLDKQVRDHFLANAKLEIAPKFRLRVEPNRKNHLGPEASPISLISTGSEMTAFKIGLNPLDDALIRIFLMWTGYRRYELVYAQLKNTQKKIKKLVKGSNLRF